MECVLSCTIHMHESVSFFYSNLISWKQMQILSRSHSPLSMNRSVSSRVDRAFHMRHLHSVRHMMQTTAVQSSPGCFLGLTMSKTVSLMIHSHYSAHETEPFYSHYDMRRSKQTHVSRICYLRASLPLDTPRSTRSTKLQHLSHQHDTECLSQKAFDQHPRITNQNQPIWQTPAINENPMANSG